MTETPNRTRGLGRGLSALMADVTGLSESTPTEGFQRRPEVFLPIDRLRANPNQPRRSFPQQDMEDLAASIREKGIIQPLIVRPAPQAADQYEIVAGERRFRAAQMAQLHEVPAIIRSYSDSEVLEVAIIENIQRADLNPIDEAAGYRALMEQFGHTQEKLATALGKSRSHIANQVRLLVLPPEVQELLISGALTAGHGRAIIGHPQAALLAQRIVQGKLSVRDAEKLARAPVSVLAPKASSRPVPKDPDTVQIEHEMTAALGLGVTIDHTPGGEGGRLILRYRSLSQLDDILRALSDGPGMWHGR
jgi:ParB family transcriptional regulator, chromosome partitioning protein